MIKKTKAAAIIALALFIPNGAMASLTLKEVRTASANVLVAYFTSDTLDITVVDINHITEWKLNGQPPLNIFRYVFSHVKNSSPQADRIDHHIYLELDKELVEGKDYLLETPYGNKEFTFSQREVFCESLKTNQVGYSALSKTRYANFAIWLGTGGIRKINGPLPSYEVFETATNKLVAEGTLEETGADTSSGDHVYRVDLSGVPEGGPYKVAVSGIGCSYPFGVGGEFSRKLAYTIFRAQYLQRCGCPVLKPHPIRMNPCHTIVYDTDAPIGEANIVVRGDEPTFKCYGGYHDAGDADRRAYHISNPMVNLMIWEVFPGLFHDGQFDIPGEFDENYYIKSYTNDIPDIIDEAEWGTLIWEYLQNEDGSVHFGTETTRYPKWDEPMDQDEKKYGTVRVDDRATCPAAGLFLHLARILEPYKPERSKELIARGEKAMEFCGESMAKPEQLYYYIQKYLLTGDESAHRKVKELYQIAGDMKDHLFVTPGYSLNDEDFDNPAYIMSYVLEKDLPTDPGIVAHFRSAIRDAADRNMAELRKYAYPVGNNSAGRGWGHNVRQPLYACAPLLQWMLSGEQEYLDASSELMDYKLGLNPVGMSYVAGLGFNSVRDPNDREASYTIKKGWGPRPGITVFGPGIPQEHRWTSYVIPEMGKLSKERQYVDDRRIISFNEFTIFETMTHDALYTILSGGKKWDGSDPFAPPED